MSILFAVLWVLVGLLGSFMIRLDWAWSFDEDVLCISPFKYLVYIVSGVITGPLVLLCALVIWIVEGRFINPVRNSWFFRPICKAKDGSYR